MVGKLVEHLATVDCSTHKRQWIWPICQPCQWKAGLPFTHLPPLPSQPPHMQEQEHTQHSYIPGPYPTYREASVELRNIMIIL